VEWQNCSFATQINLITSLENNKHSHELVVGIERRSLCCPLQIQPEQTPWPESASELYRPSDCCMLAKLVPTSADRGVSRIQRGLGRPPWGEDGPVMCSEICQWSESLRTDNHTLLSHLRLLGSLSVASYDSQGIRWKYPATRCEYDIPKTSAVALISESCFTNPNALRRDFHIDVASTAGVHQPIIGRLFVNQRSNSSVLMYSFLTCADQINAQTRPRS
jgi:hypothetical protein